VKCTPCGALDPTNRLPYPGFVGTLREMHRIATTPGANTPERLEAFTRTALLDHLHPSTGGRAPTLSQLNALRAGYHQLRIRLLGA
jgi:hypothetical protein